MTTATAASSVGRAVALVLGALVVLTAGATPAHAHASLTASTPADGQQLDSPPTEIRLELNEPVTTPRNALRLFDRDGQRVATGDATGDGSPTIAVPLLDPLDDGAYVATYRVSSADGHVVRGAFVFTVGESAAVDDTLAARLFAGGDSAIAVAADATVRVLTYAGVLLAAGAVAFAFAVAGRRDRDDLARAGRWARTGSLVAMGATLVAIPVTGAVTAGVGPLGALSPDVLADTLRGPVGQAALIRLVALAVLLVAASRPGDVRGRVAVAAAAATLGSFLWDGHTRTVEPLWLMLSGDAVHLAAGATWFGGLVVLAAALRARRLADDPVGGARVVARFSRLAMISVAVVSLGGLAMSVPLVRAPRTLTTTTYGWMLLVKVTLVGLVVLVAAYNNRRLVPLVAAAGRRVPAGGSLGTTRDVPAAATDRLASAADAAWHVLRRTVRIEATGLVAVLAVTGLLVNQRPAAEEAGITGAYQTTVALGEDLDVDLVVDPNRVGPNAIHLYVLDETGRPVRDAGDVTLRMTLPSRDLGPIERTPDTAGPGHWVLYGEQVPLAGEWRFEVTLGTGAFAEKSVEIPVHVNP